MGGFSHVKVLEMLYDARFHLELNFQQHSYQDIDGDEEARRRLAKALGLEFEEPKWPGHSGGFLEKNYHRVTEEALMAKIIKAIKKDSARGDHDLAVFVETSQIVETCSVGAMQWVRALSLPSPKQGSVGNFSYVEKDITYKRAHWAVAWVIEPNVGKEDPDSWGDDILEPEGIITSFNDNRHKEEVIDKFTEAIVAIEQGRGREIWAGFNKFYPPKRKKKVSA